MQVPASLSLPPALPTEGLVSGAFSPTSALHASGNPAPDSRQSEPSESFQSKLGSAQDEAQSRPTASPSAQSTVDSQSGARTATASKADRDENAARKSPASHSNTESSASAVSGLLSSNDASTLAMGYLVLPPQPPPFPTLPSASSPSAPVSQSALPSRDAAAWAEAMQTSAPSEASRTATNTLGAKTLTTLPTEIAAQASLSDENAKKSAQAAPGLFPVGAESFAVVRQETTSGIRAQWVPGVLHAGSAAASQMASVNATENQQARMSTSGDTAPSDAAANSASAQPASTLQATSFGAMISSPNTWSVPGTGSNGVGSRPAAIKPAMNSSLSSGSAVLPVTTTGSSGTGSSSGNDTGRNTTASQGGGPTLAAKPAGADASPSGATTSYTESAEAHAGQMLATGHAMPGVVQATSEAANDSPAGAGPADHAETAMRSPAATATNSDSTSLPALNTAQVVQSMGQTEMRVGMHSQEFGSISISTTLSHQELAAQISIDHSGLGDALTAHLPDMQEKLGTAYGVQARVEIRDTGAQSSGGGANPQQQDAGAGQRSGSSGYGAPQPIRGEAVTSSIATNVVSSSMQPAVSDNTARLSIRI